MNRVVIVGSGGQDGTILFDRLSSEGCAIVGIERNRIRSAGPIGPDVPPAVDLLDDRQVLEAVRLVSPQALYYLAAYHHSSEERTEEASLLFRRSLDVHVLGLVNALEAIRQSAPSCRVFYAASSHLFGNPDRFPQDETTPIEPRGAYAISKAAGLHTCRLYRETFGLHVSVGILYNHESHLRPAKFVSQRIIRGALDARRGLAQGRVNRIRLGNLAAVADWGYAPDTVDAMIRMVSLAQPEDFVVATGEPHTVQEFVEIAFRALGLDWTKHVEEDRAILQRPPRPLVGNPGKLRALTGWKPSVTFEGMIRLLLEQAS